MSEEAARFYGGDCRVRVVTSRIQARGDAYAPRLLVNFELTLSPFEKHGFDILVFTGCLLHKGSVVADAIPSFCVAKVTPGKKQLEVLEVYLDFPLDPYRVQRIESERDGGNVIFDYYLTFVIYEYEPIPVRVGESDIVPIWAPKGFVVSHSHTTLSSEIAKSIWEERLLPHLKSKEFFILPVQPEKDST